MQATGSEAVGAVTAPKLLLANRADFLSSNCLHVQRPKKAGFRNRKNQTIRMRRTYS
jgi:hypothetical protein